MASLPRASVLLILALDGKTCLRRDKPPVQNGTERLERTHFSLRQNFHTGRWMMQQARNLTMIFDQESVKPKYLLRDRDSKFVQEFDAILASESITVTPIGVRAPNQNAVAERF